MKVRHLVSVGAVALFTVGCGYAIKTSTDYDRSVRFTNYKSFFIMKGNSSGNALMDQRAQADVKSALMAKGLMEVPEGQGQVAVVVHAATKTKHTYETLYDGWGGWGWRRGFGGGEKLLNILSIACSVALAFEVALSDRASVALPCQIACLVFASKISTTNVPTL